MPMPTTVQTAPGQRDGQLAGQSTRSNAPIETNTTRNTDNRPDANAYPASAPHRQPAARVRDLRWVGNGKWHGYVVKLNRIEIVSTLSDGHQMIISTLTLAFLKKNEMIIPTKTACFNTSLG